MLVLSLSSSVHFRGDFLVTAKNHSVAGLFGLFVQFANRPPDTSSVSPFKRERSVL